MTTHHLPLTLLSDEERMFRDAVAEFAESEVRPRVQSMETAKRIDPDLIPSCLPVRGTAQRT